MSNYKKLNTEYLYKLMLDCIGFFIFCFCINIIKRFIMRLLCGNKLKNFQNSLDIMAS